jgi:cobalamin biosynthesis Mg chelatase CobN
MTKKVFISVLVGILLSLCSSFCFAATNTNQVNLGNDISSSVNKGVNTVEGAAKDVVGAGEKAVNGVGDAIGNMGNTNTNNSNYNTTRTSTTGTTNSSGMGMSTTTWMWIILAIAAVIIIAAIWYYAMQGNDRD